jgi:hypothetical protein
MYAHYAQSDCTVHTAFEMVHLLQRAPASLASSHHYVPQTPLEQSDELYPQLLRFSLPDTNLERHHNTNSGPISIKISIGIIRNHLPDTLSPFLELSRPWLWGAVLLKLCCNGIFSFGVLSTNHTLSYQIIIT